MTECRSKIHLCGGREVYLKKDNVKCEEDAGILTNPSVHLHAFVIGCSYKGSTVVLVKETYCRYKIPLGTGIGRYIFKKFNVKFQTEVDPGRQMI